MKIESNANKGGTSKFLQKRNSSAGQLNEMGLPQSHEDFNPNSTQTNALLSIRDNQFNLIL